MNLKVSDSSALFGGFIHGEKPRHCLILGCNFNSMMNRGVLHA